MKKILFLIYTSGGNGGHYRSMISLISSFQGKFETNIVNIGQKVSSVIKNSGFPYEFVFFDKTNWRKLSVYLDEYISKNHIDIVHAYDYISYDAVFDAANCANIPIVLTKCGGPTVRYKALFPRVENLVLFSKEDCKYFSKRKGYPNYVQIPNRVLAFCGDSQMIGRLREGFHLDGKKIVLRIGRIGHAYIHTIRQSIDLTKFLHTCDPDYTLLLIGSVDNEDVLMTLQAEVSEMPFIHVITDPQYTKDARTIIDISDVVVGTGRGFMEACSRNKIMFAPTNNGKFPMPVTDETFDDIFTYNFSERYTSQKEVNDNDIWNHVNTQSHSVQWYRDYFDMASALPKYMELYETLLRTYNYYRIDVIISKFLITLSSFELIKKVIRLKSRNEI